MFRGWRGLSDVAFYRSFTVILQEILVNNIWITLSPFFSYAPWCPVCQQMESAWEAFARDSDNLEISVGKVDVTQEPGKDQPGLEKIDE